MDKDKTKDIIIELTEKDKHFINHLVEVNIITIKEMLQLLKTGYLEKKRLKLYYKK